MSKRRTAAKAPSVIDQAIAAFRETWLRAEDTVDGMLRAPIAPSIAKPIVLPVASGASDRIIAKGCEGEAVQELRIRLAGFGGLLPGESFDDDTEDSVKQFEKDVMHRVPTGKVDPAFAAALDMFASDWPIDVEKQLACPCVTARRRLQGCSGFGKGQFRGEYSPGHEKDRNEAYHKYEYPGIHRSLLWAARALMFYATVDHKNEIRFLKFSSGYRCHKDNEANHRTSTNHMGKAMDMQFSHWDGRKWIVPDEAQTMKDANAMREVAKARMDAQSEWGESDRFALELGGKLGNDKKHAHAPTWVHMDVRTWSARFREDSYFVRTASALDGDSFVTVFARSSPSGLGSP